MAGTDAWGGAWLTSWLETWFGAGVIIPHVGPLISQAVFRMEKTTGTFAIGETLGIFRKPKSDGIFKP